MKKLVTHNGRFHTDDVFACAVLQFWLEKQGESFEVVRTRDESIIEAADYVFDVGGIYDPSINRFDHHQKESAGVRENTIPYASFGLVWKHYGMDICMSKIIFDEIDLDIICGIDAIDNGISITEKLFKGVNMVHFGDLGDSFMPTWKNSDVHAFDKGFDEMVKIAKGFLARIILTKSDIEEGKKILEEIYQKTEDKRLIVLNKYYQGKEILAKHPEPLIVIHPDVSNERWMMTTVRDDGAGFVNRKDFPAEWGGLRGEAFAEVSGVPDAEFCHKGLWLAGAKSFEGILSLAQKALAA